MKTKRRNPPQSSTALARAENALLIRQGNEVKGYTLKGSLLLFLGGVGIGYGVSVLTRPKTPA